MAENRPQYGSSQVLELINRIQVAWVAACSDGQPTVRGIMTYRADNEGIVLHTGEFKDFYRQLKANPRCELCFFEPQEQVQIRVRGNAAELDDQALKEEIVGARPFLQPWVEAQGYDMLKVFRIKDAEFTVWTMDRNFEPTAFKKL